MRASADVERMKTLEHLSLAGKNPKGNVVASFLEVWC